MPRNEREAYSHLQHSGKRYWHQPKPRYFTLTAFFKFAWLAICVASGVFVIKMLVDGFIVGS